MSEISDEMVRAFRIAERTAQGFRKKPNERVRAGLAAALAGHVLLPSGGEVSTQWSIVFQDGFRAKTWDERLMQSWCAWLVDPSIYTVGPIQRRTVTTWGTGDAQTKLVGPWSPVLSDNSEKGGGS